MNSLILLPGSVFFPVLLQESWLQEPCSGTVHDYLLLLAIFLMFGPLGTGFSQSVNDCFDLELDRVNEPTRPIPSGRLSEKEGLWNSIIALLLAIGLGIFMGVHIGGFRGMGYCCLHTLPLFLSPISIPLLLSN